MKTTSIYSDEAKIMGFNSADDLSVEAKFHKNKTKKVLKKINSRQDGNDTVKNFLLLNEEETKRVLKVIDKKIEKLHSTGGLTKNNYDKNLGYLVGLKELLLEK